MKRVKFTCDWCDDASLKERFLKCYLSSFFKINFTITVESDYDILVTINKPAPTIREKGKKYIGVFMEPSWLLGEDKKTAMYITCDYVLTYIKHSKFKNNIYYPGLLPFHLTYDEGPNLDYYLRTSHDTKRNSCSIIVSRDKISHSTDILYKQRVNLAEKIIESDLPIDIYGKGWDRFVTYDNRIKGSLDLEEKYKGLQDYKFSICIENCSEESYFTEKITDCILVNTIPLYYGCNHIQKFFRSPIKLSTLSPNGCIDEIKDILREEKLKSFYQEDKMLLANKFNLFAAITKLIQILN